MNETTPSSLAQAQARRLFSETERVASRIEQLIGQPVVPTPEDTRTASINRFALLNQKLLISRNNTAAMRTIILNSNYDEAGRIAEPNLNASPSSLITDSQKPQIAREAGESFVDTLFSGRQAVSVEDYLKELNRAETIARERGITPDKVYDNDGLYVELVRAVHTPESIANRNIAVADNITPARIEGIMLGIARSLMMAELATKKLSPEKAEAYTASHLEGLLHAKMFQDQATVMAETFKGVLYIVAAENVERFWGENATALLPENMQASIAMYRQGNMA